VSKQLLQQDFLKTKLKNFGLTEEHLDYLAICIETHDVLGKQLRDVLKHSDRLSLDYISTNPQEMQEMCKKISEKYSDIKIEIGVFFLCDLLGKTNIRIQANTDAEINQQQEKIVQTLKQQNLASELKKAILQLPLTLKLAEIYLNTIFNVY